MLTLRDLQLQRGGRTLFRAVSLDINPGQKVGIVGANGSGKSSLLALVNGELHPDGGELKLPPGLCIASVAQETPAVDRPAVDYVLDGDFSLRAVEAALARAGARDQGERVGELHGQLEALDGYGARARAGRLMAGLGFGAGELERPVRTFSGGWRARLNLARALIRPSDLLLLDEPTNHLDLDAVIWLEQWLRSYPGTLLLISHDREFLDNVVGSIAHVHDQDIRLYAGGYSDFERQRAQRLAQQQALHARQQREVARLHGFIDRFRAKATKARQVQSRLKALDRLEQVAPAHADSPFHFAFPEPRRLPHPTLVLEEAVLGHAGTPVLEGVDLVIQPGMRLGLLGPNGAGKSTLIKTLAGDLPLLAGRRAPGQGLEVGYFAQHQLEQLRTDSTPLAHLQRLDPGAPEQALRDFLGGFGFPGDRALAPVAPFSGGEKARLVLALLVWQRPGLLLLDEPTNHLDLEMRHALTVALQDYPGAVVVVSHDRHLLRATTDDFALVAGARCRPFDGDLDDYREWLARSARPAADGSGGDGGRREQRRAEAERRQALSRQRRPLERRLADLEQTLEGLARRKAELEAELARPEVYAHEHRDRLRASLREQARVAGELDSAESQWLALQEQLERLDAGDAGAS